MNNDKQKNASAVHSMKIEGAYCTSCVAVLTRSLLMHKDIVSVMVSPQLDEVRVEYTAGSITREELERIVQSEISESRIALSSREPEYHPDEDSRMIGIKSQTAVDPVCHMTVQVDGNELNCEFSGVRYYFCAKTCKTAFENTPSSFMNQSV